MTSMEPDAFWKRVKKTKTCWLWTGVLDAYGYGSIQLGRGRFVKAHRYLWMWMNGPIGEGLVIRHRCDTPSCVRPEHLEIGTPADNSRDMVNRGRSTKGTKNPVSKLTEEQVAEIRRLYTDDGVRQFVLAKTFGVGRTLIHNIVHRKRW